MCLAIPARIVSIDDTGQTARVSLGGVVKEVSLALVDGVAVGDYVLVHVGYALNRIEEDEAAQTLAMIAEIGMLSDVPDTASPQPGHSRAAPPPAQSQTQPRSQPPGTVPDPEPIRGEV